MATGGVRRLYEEDDKVDEYLLNQVSKWVLYHRLGQLARDLGITEAEFSRIAIAATQPEEQILKVLYRWYTKNTLTIKDLMTHMVAWQTERYLDRSVWRHLQSKIDPNALPGDISTLQLPAPPEGPNPYVYQDDKQTAYIVEMPPESSPSDDSPSNRTELPSQFENRDMSAEMHQRLISFMQAGFLGRSFDMRTHLDRNQKRLQKRLKESLRRRCRNFLSTDWLPVEKAKSFQLRNYYVETRWLQVQITARSCWKLEMERIQDIFNNFEEDGPVNILAIGEAGTGKSCCMAMLASDWAQPEQTELSGDITRLKSFDFVFLIQLCHVNDNSSLEKIILKQHGLMNKDISEREISDILRGRTEASVLLLLDGYDEYKKGRNTDIDMAIEHTIGDCFLILTSRDGEYFSSETRRKMNGVMEITGFDTCKVRKYAEQYFESEEIANRMYRKATVAGIEGLLRLPIILLMICVLFDEKEDLPKSQIEIISCIVEMFMDRSAIKHFGRKAKDIVGLNEMLYKLGELAWIALRKDSRQLLLSKTEVERASETLLRLGILHEATFEQKTSLTGRICWLMFPHKLFQEYWAGYYASKRLCKARAKDEISKIFTFPEDMKHQWNVVKFTCGLMDDSSVLIKRVCEAFVDIMKNTTFVWYDKSFQFLYNYTYLADLHHEKSPTSLNPFRNNVICCMKDRNSVLRENSQSYYFYGTDCFENYQTEPGLVMDLQEVRKKSTKPCAVFIREPTNSPHFMYTAQCSISRIKQSLKYLRVDGAKLGNLFFGMTGRQMEMPSEQPSGFIFGMTGRQMEMPSEQPSGFHRVLDFADKAVVRFTACDFRWNNLKLIVDSIKHCRTLHSFELAYCKKVDENLICHLGQNKDLCSLTVCDIHRGLSLDVREKLFEQIKLLGSLTHLIIHDMDFDIASVRSTSLTEVSLCCCGIECTEGLALMKHLAKCPVQKLHLDDNHLSEMFKKLCKLPDISYPYLRSMSLVRTRAYRSDLRGIVQLLRDDKMPAIQEVMVTEDEFSKPTLLEFEESCRRYRKSQCRVVRSDRGRPLLLFAQSKSTWFKDDDTDDDTDP